MKTVSAQAKLPKMNCIPSRGNALSHEAHEGQEGVGSLIS
jgi:hypothetical protein